MANSIQAKLLESVIMPSASYGYEIWSFTHTEEHMLRMVENVVIEEYFKDRQEIREG
jgi:hypothetical protein